jgi:hypothetical protein
VPPLRYPDEKGCLLGLGGDCRIRTPLHSNRVAGGGSPSGGEGAERPPPGKTSRYDQIIHAPESRGVCARVYGASNDIDIDPIYIGPIKGRRCKSIR